MKIKSLLIDEVQNQIVELNKMEVGSEQYKVAVDGVTRLIDRINDIRRLDIEREDRYDQREVELTIKLQEIEEDKKDRRARNRITIIGIAVPTAVTIWGTLKSFKFEETGTITTMMGRGFISKLLPRK